MLVSGKAHTTPSLPPPYGELENFEWIELQMVNKHWKIWRVLKRPIWVWNRKCFSALPVKWGGRRESGIGGLLWQDASCCSVTSHGTACLSCCPPVRLTACLPRSAGRGNKTHRQLHLLFRDSPPVSPSQSHVIFLLRNIFPISKFDKQRRIPPRSQQVCLLLNKTFWFPLE